MSKTQNTKSQEKTLIVGMPGFLNSEGMFGITGHYIKWLSTLGNVRIIMPWEEYVEVDLLVLPGGLDLSPSTYGQIPDFKTGNHDVFKEFFFKERLQTYIDNGVAIFGICLGAQMLNVRLGGTLTQHVWGHQNAERGKIHHTVKVPSMVMDEYDKKGNKTNKKVMLEIGVNSHHHQAILESDLAPNLELFAYDDYCDTKIVEACIHNQLPIAMVQFHPEEIYDEISSFLVNQIIKRSKELKEVREEQQPVAEVELV